MCMIGDFLRMEDVPKEKAWKGWRQWRVRERRLRSLSRHVIWYGRGKRADATPTWYNNSGIWAHNQRPSRGETHLVRGQVLLWGPTVVHQWGRRALRARIISLSDPKLAKKYGVEVCK